LVYYHRTREELKKKYHKARIGNMIAVCFAANLGGTGVVTGCAPNLILLGILDAYVVLTPSSNTNDLQFFALR
jgi:Na+/H+ antiporter NhaD/arsenite permease-like protein